MQPELYSRAAQQLAQTRGILAGRPGAVQLFPHLSPVKGLMGGNLSRWAWGGATEP